MRTSTSLQEASESPNKKRKLLGSPDLHDGTDTGIIAKSEVVKQENLDGRRGSPEVLPEYPDRLGDVDNGDYVGTRDLKGNDNAEPLDVMPLQGTAKGTAVTEPHPNSPKHELHGTDGIKTDTSPSRAAPSKTECEPMENVKQPTMVSSEPAMQFRVELLTILNDMVCLS